MKHDNNSQANVRCNSFLDQECRIRMEGRLEGRSFEFGEVCQDDLSDSERFQEDERSKEMSNKESPIMWIWLRGERLHYRCTYIHTYIGTYIHTSVHTYMYTYI